MSRSPFAFIVIALTVACGFAWSPAEAQTRGSTSRAERMGSVLSTEHAHFHGPARELVRDSATFHRLWREMGSSARAPQIDFQGSVVILVALGTRPTTGYEVHIRQLRSTGTELHVFVDLIEPGPECPVGAEVQSPATMIEGMLGVSTSAPPTIVFHDRKLMSQCSPD